MTNDEIKEAAERLVADDYTWVSQSVADYVPVAKAYLAHLAADEQCEREDKEPITEEWLRSLGWHEIGNAYYQPEADVPREFDGPLVMWNRVDGTIRITGSQWSSRNDAPRGQLRKLLEALRGCT